MKNIRWGIIGTGGIAHRFAAACKNTPGALLDAVASRNIDTANAFADEFDIKCRFGSYLEMLQSDAVDAVYIAVPHGLHAENAILCMENGKAVLSEKPITVNAKQFEYLMECSMRNNVFLMEAMWARLVPGTKKLLDFVNSGALGKIKCVQGSFCYEMSDEPDHHAFKPEYGGGSLLDVGCYGLSFASWYLGRNVADIQAMAEIDANNVDVHTCIQIKYSNDAIACISSAMMLDKPNEGYIFGEKGYVYCRRFYAPQEYVVHIAGRDDETVKCPYYGNGFEEQIMEASDCIREGKIQSDLIPHSQSLYIMRQMDKIRKIIGVKYPADE